MELFTLLVNPARLNTKQMMEELANALRSELGFSDDFELRPVPLSGGTGIVCDVAASQRSDEALPALRKSVASVLASYMMTAYEEQVMARLIHKEMNSAANEDIASVAVHCKQLLTMDVEEWGTKDGCPQRQTKLASLIEAYLRDEKYLHFEGFLRFRAGPYVEELRDTVSYAVDEWMMERQYQEFIALLKYFVYIQEAKIPVAHLVHKGNHEFTLLNEQMKPIDTKQMDQFVVELIDKDINYEDVIVSTLITVSPGKLLIHTKAPELQVIKTILTIFEGRVDVCTDCHVCVPLLEESKR
ncbi:putative sporulation protein YtxC [Paenibacillus thermotolerans]|uniref:putative sporulation protein YtxC n=1 Tax=Paenibacillus thermotolerans TaxID=3027807 RepID=UPI002367DC7C|nr:MULTISPECIES: putative sporulation protein YtxC [unclassified Paenibacillus]